MRAKENSTKEHSRAREKKGLTPPMLSSIINSRVYLLLSLFYFLSSTIYLLLSISYYLYSTTYLSSTTIFYYPSSAMYQSSAIFICLSLLSVTCLSTFRAHITLSIEPRGPSVSKSHSGFECFVSSVETLRRTDVNDVSTLTKMSIATHHNIAGGGV